MSIDHLSKRLSDMILSDEVSRADLDELVLISQSILSALPDRFISVLYDADGSVNTMTAHARMKALERLDRILEVAKNFPPEPSVSSFNELIPMFALDESDKARVIELCATMRKIVHAADQFDQPHKLRLLNRIAAIEAEVHKQKGMFDVVRSGISDVGETLGKFGGDIKPLTDRMAEVVGIVRKATKVYDQLPVPEEVKKLPPPASE